jgi:DeoR/GlpR family transcriptional regulator of sugar metabolism
MMLARQRRSMILAHVHAKGGMRVRDLADLLRVSTSTARRDLAVLARDGQIVRVHGGAVRA